MKINFEQSLKTLDGEPILDGNGKSKIILSNVCVQSLLTTFNSDQELSGEEKVKRYELALKIRNAQTLDLVSEDIVLLKRLIAKLYGPLVVGQAWRMLEGR